MTGTILPSGNILLRFAGVTPHLGCVEELEAVLALAEKHGVAVARSNNSAYMPISSEVHGRIKDRLVRCSVIPFGAYPLMVVKRELSKMFGPVDDSFFERINRRGWSTVVANRAYADNGESAPIPARDLFPYAANVDPLDLFAEIFGGAPNRKKKILISLWALGPIHNGTSEWGVGFLREFVALFGDKYDMHVLTNPAADVFHGISKICPNVHYPDNLNETFDLAYAPQQIFFLENLQLLVRTSARVVTCMQDIIGLRCQYCAEMNPQAVDIFRLVLEYADGILGFSRFSLEDMRMFAPGSLARREIPGAVVYLASDALIVKEADGQKRPFDEYFFVYGNGTYDHKCIPEFCRMAVASKFNFVVLGTLEEGYLAPNIYGLKSGAIPQVRLDFLRTNAKAFVFPSVYEGFGLAVVHAIDYRKKVIVYDSPLNHELAVCFNYFADNMLYFSNHSEMFDLIGKVDSDPSVRMGEFHRRTMQDVVIETDACLARMLEGEIDLERFRRRYSFFAFLKRTFQTETPQVRIVERVNGMPVESGRVDNIKARLPWPLRKVFGGLACVGENGFGYTIHKTMDKVRAKLSKKRQNGEATRK